MQFQPNPRSRPAHQTATLMLWCSSPALWLVVAVTAPHPTGATEPNWMILPGKTWWNQLLQGESFLLHAQRYQLWEAQLWPHLARQQFQILRHATHPPCAHSSRQHVLITNSPSTKLHLCSPPFFPPNQILPFLHIHSSVPLFYFQSFSRQIFSWWLFTPPTNYNRGLSLTLNYFLIVFPLSVLSPQ